MKGMCGLLVDWLDGWVIVTVSCPDEMLGRVIVIGFIFHLIGGGYEKV